MKNILRITRNIPVKTLHVQDISELVVSALLVLPAVEKLSADLKVFFCLPGGSLSDVETLIYICGAMAENIAPLCRSMTKQDKLIG